MVKLEEERHEEDKEPMFLNLIFLSSTFLVLILIRILVFGFDPFYHATHHPLYQISVICHIRNCQVTLR